MTPNGIGDAGRAEDVVANIIRHLTRFAPAYCDYLAFEIRAGLFAVMDGKLNVLIKSVGPVVSDIHSKQGYLLSTKKTIEAADVNGRRYRITVEEIEDMPKQHDDADDAGEQPLVTA